MSKKSLSISGDTTGPFECVGWKSDRTGIFVSDKEGERRFVELIRPTIRGIDCYKQPFDLSHPTSIEAIRLVPPPWRSSKTEADALANWTKNIGWGKIKTFEDAQADYSEYANNMGCKTVQFPELWEMIYGECLSPDKNVVEALKPIVSDHYKKQGAECRHRLLQLKETTKKEIQTLGKDKAHDYNWSERKAKRKNISDLYSRFLDDPNKRNQREWKILVHFETEASAITPGQSAVFYDGNRVLGGGFIAFQNGANAAFVSAVRQASIPISVILGAVLLHETSMLRRLKSASLIAVTALSASSVVPMLPAGILKATFAPGMLPSSIKGTPP